ncbi:HEPN domain-containing protein [Siphonobacter sp. SORGH_AS_0500]|uniref:HEPN domain-containing protein n=1 Tax=Siphonobacter sp. SORGH_AS_0500 TaxID=1864824 RepID=UPI0038F6C861
MSGNPFRTKSLFKKFGIDLDKNDIFNIQKESVNNIVNKRNKVLHHNDEASDISNQDLLRHIDSLVEYMTNIDKIVCLHLQ